jgi:menaquinone-dependent protoporphyrinogen oxidase
MNILIAVASRHGSTLEIAEALAQELRAAGHTIDLRRIEGTIAVGRYDAAIIGSAIYMGGWLAEARQFVERNRAKLAGIPVWLFSSGPLSRDDSQSQSDPAQIDELRQAVAARDHRVFVGKLDKRGLGVGERLIARMVGAPEGDFRDWDAICAWAREIAAALPAPADRGA